MASTDLYDKLIWELRKIIFSRGLTMQQCDDLSGNQDGYTAKMLHPNTESGRQAKWLQMENLIRALLPCDYRLRLIPLKPLAARGPGTIERRSQSDAGRVAIRDYSRAAGLKSWESRRARLTPEQWSKFCSRAAKARWRRRREAPKP